jgi:flagellar basal-body rod protein FlgG
MANAIRDVVSGALFHELRMSTLANNIANTGTVGFKEDKVAFDLPGEEDGSAGTATAGTGSPQESYLGNPVSTYIDFTPGHIVHSGNPMDFALEGDGFFTVTTPEGTRYTRSGNFTRNTEGVLVTVEGYPVMGEGGEIELTGTNIEVDGTGNIRMDGVPVDRLKVVDFPQESGLIKSGKNTFATAGPDVREQAAEDVTVVQGSIERSNVDVVKSMTEMIEVLRGYESYQKVIQFLNEANEKIISEVGRPY